MRKLFILIAVMLCFGAALAQESGIQDPRAAIISWAVDQYGKDSGLPSGDGELSAAEEQIGTIMSDAVEEYAQSDAPLDPRAEAISHAVAQYGQDETYTGPDPRAEAISGAVAQYGRTETPVRDIRAEILSGAIEQYGKENGIGENPSVPDTRARIISEAVAQYIAESDIPTPRKPTTRKRADWLIYQAVEIMVASETLPTNGYWRPQPFSMTMTGQCKAEYGDNDGPSGREGETDPGRPLCGYAAEGRLPFIVWDGATHPYLPGTSSIYSQEPGIRYEPVMDSNGQQVGSVKLTTTVEYEVVASNLIIVHLYMEEEGGCTMSAEYKLELVTADESVCVPMTSLPTPEPEPTEPPPPVDEPYQVTLALPLDETQCNDKNTPPQFSEARLQPQPDGSMVIDYGSGTQQVFPIGSGDWYQYENNASDLRTSILLNVFGDGTGSIFWSLNSRDGNICAVSFDLVQPSSPTLMTPTPEAAPFLEDVTSGANGESGAAGSPTSAILPGRYTVEWDMDMMDMLCPVDLQPIAPTFTEVTLTQIDATSFLFDDGTAQYPLVDMTGEQFYSYMDMGSDMLMSMSIFAADTPGVVSLVWNGTPTNSSTACMVMAELTRVG